MNHFINVSKLVILSAIIVLGIVSCASMNNNGNMDVDTRNLTGIRVVDPITMKRYTLRYVGNGNYHVYNEDVRGTHFYEGE